MCLPVYILKGGEYKKEKVKKGYPKVPHNFNVLVTVFRKQLIVVFDQVGNIDLVKQLVDITIDGIVGTLNQDLTFGCFELNQIELFVALGHRTFEGTNIRTSELRLRLSVLVPKEQIRGDTRQSGYAGKCSTDLIVVNKHGITPTD
ncbi:hypothetical protein ST201phi2-1p082 [Pseudomonas phage 201phi2-1]|uniref:Uncharacterized protein n=1 Tax=Pseudomonas phage 201phi2-1 TaxID=198110 RepID=B3FK57_BP201|nr:hypothetical protein ST201phi2-1p082 [Pseudomonas phage 201phi2-1]ABY62915.1 hypothetical protein 201phi2-1p082 [Pseudomonas phage 201phi2-1]